MPEVTPPSQEWLAEFFKTPRRIAMVGLSRNRERSAYGVAERLGQLGFTVVPVHPKAEEVGGERGYKRLSDVPGPVDVVNVFLRSELLDGIADDVLALRPGLVWLQVGVRRDDLAERWSEAGIAVVQDACLGVLMPRYLSAD